jgi:disulfide bond formation protein DsbB
MASIVADQRSFRLLVPLAGLGSAALLAGAFAFQYIGGLAPCALCIWQRWPHAAAVAIMALALLVPHRGLVALGALAALSTAGIGGFHMGVEYGWWAGLQSCSGGSIAGVSVADLLNPDTAVAAPVRCDEVPWSLLGMSMAGWNMVLSLGLAGVWALALRRN